VTSPTARRLESLSEADLQALSEVLIDCVDGGASVSFMAPLSPVRAEAYWQGVAASLALGERLLFVVDDDEGRPAGTVQVLLAQPDNQPHRGDVAKMLVHSRMRRRGLGEVLLRAAETGARAAGKTLLVLDTAGAEAARLYERAGWTRVGVIPDYALLPYGGLCATTYYYKAL
jgi:GNAT superfamily N-acetyltransferase